MSSAARGRASRSPASAWGWAHVVMLVLVIGALGHLIWSAWDHEAFLTWKREAPPLVFFAAMALLPALGFPLTPFYLAAGATFGGRVGLIGSVAAVAVNLSLTYLLARTALRGWVLSMLSRFGRELPDLSAREHGALRLSLLVKLAPGVPASIKHYALAVSGVPFPIYFAVCMSFAMLYAIPLVVLGESLFAHDVGVVAVSVAAVACLAAAGWWWHGRRETTSASEGPA